ncbi:MAG: hypothetical protein NT090_24275 [Acidobacteria bacterium]|nr:hypothetical protein [Acidobacteriota bacterium]
MRFISSLDQHPEARRQRFPKRLWPGGNDPKDVAESWIVIEFTSAAGLRLDNAPTKLQPPMPDFECIIHGERLLFELGEMLQSNLAEGVAYSAKQSHKKMEAISRGDIETANSIQTAGSRSFPANASLERMLRQKLTKTYKTEGLPSHLLLFYDQQVPLGPFDYVLQWQQKIAGLIAGSVFQRVWIFELGSRTVIGYLEAAYDGTLRVLFDWRFHFDFRAPFEALVPGCGDRPDEVRRFVPVEAV